MTLYIILGVLIAGSGMLIWAYRAGKKVNSAEDLKGAQDAAIEAQNIRDRITRDGSFERLRERFSRGVLPTSPSDSDTSN